MLTPKDSHLVERVTERLLRTGALDASATQLLQPSAPSEADRAAQTVPGAASRSSLSAAPQMSLAEMPLTTIVQQEAYLERPADAARGEAFAVDIAETIVEPVGFAEAADTTRVAAPSTLAQAGLLPAVPRDDLTETDLRQMPSIKTIDTTSLERAGMVDWSRTRTRISEEFRLVQRQILRTAFGPDAQPGFSNLLMVTSARPGEGKSFMSLNMAGSIARQGDNHVLFVDADSKPQSVCQSLGLAQAQGLLDLASDPSLDPGSLLVRSSIERLSILPVGRERERSAELFSTKEMTKVIQSLGRRYADRLLILDASPCLSTSDPALLAQVVGQVLFVVEANRTQRDEVEASLDLIQACPTITMVLNKQQMSSRYTFGAYSSYYAS